MNVEQPETVVERDREGRERLACRDREAVQSDIDRHVAARRAYEQALARVTAIEDGNLPTAQIAEAHLKAFVAYTEMTEAARNVLVVMPTDLKALVDPLLYCYIWRRTSACCRQRSPVAQQWLVSSVRSSAYFTAVASRDRHARQGR